MSSLNAITYMIIGCAVVLAVMLFSKPLAKIFKILVQGIIGAAGMYAINFLFLPAGIFVGVNLLTVLYVGILGLPGLISLYLIKLIV